MMSVDSTYENIAEESVEELREDVKNREVSLQKMKLYTG